MAEISDLTATQQQNIIDLDFTTLINRVNGLISSYKPATDEEANEKNAVCSQFLGMSSVLAAVWNSGVATADAILNP